MILPAVEPSFFLVAVAIVPLNVFLYQCHHMSLMDFVVSLLVVAEV
jgi:hypothetical protein